MTPIEHPVALITGGAGGIGAAIARRLARRGWRIVIADVDDAAGIALADEIDARFLHTDVGSLSDNTAAVAAALSHYGRLDLAMLNAGLGEPEGSLLDFDPDAYRALVAVNQDGVVYGVHAALGQMSKQGSGTIIATSSMAGVDASPINPLYAGTKHAVIGLVRSLGPVLEPSGVRINALCPTFVDTPILRDAVPYIRELGIAVLDPERAADAVEAILADERTGQAWLLVPNSDARPMDFPDTPSIMADSTATLPEIST